MTFLFTFPTFSQVLTGPAPGALGVASAAAARAAAAAAQGLKLLGETVEFLRKTRVYGVGQRGRGRGRLRRLRVRGSFRGRRRRYGLNSCGRGGGRAHGSLGRDVGHLLRASGPRRELWQVFFPPLMASNTLSVFPSRLVFCLWEWRCCCCCCCC